MSSIIKTVSYEPNETQNFRQKLGEHLGLHLLSVILKGGEQFDGILSEIGSDYFSFIVDDHDIVIPIINVLLVKYAH
jgi:hypothetical protein